MRSHDDYRRYRKIWNNSRFDFEEMLRCIFAQLELDTSVQIGDNNIIHACVCRTLCGPTGEAQMVLDENVRDDHFDGMISKEATGADNLAVPEMQIVLARGGEFYSWVSGHFIDKLEQRLLTVPVALTRLLSIVVLPHAVKSLRIGHSIRVNADCISRHLDVCAFGEDDSVVKSNGFANNSIESNCEVSNVSQISSMV